MNKVLSKDASGFGRFRTLTPDHFTTAYDEYRN
jgi:hypothetical protein